ncbi:MAG: FAD-dependent oxidoreductase, partial [Beijerinckiaceae bacterium]
MTREHIAGEIAASGYRLPVYAYRRPSDIGERIRRVPVVVVGAGLSGLACALDLTSRGVSCLVLDDDCTVGVRGASSRGIAYARKTLEILGRLGALAPVASRGVTWAVGRTFDYDHELFRFDLAADGSLLQPPFVNIQQFYVEAAMVDRAYEMGIEIRWKNTVTGIRVASDHVMLDVTTPDGMYNIEAEWLIDASGVNSKLRGQAGISVATAQGEDRWCICDVRFKRPWPIERWTWLRAHFNGGRAVWRHPLPDDVWRLDYQLPSTESAQFIDEKTAYDMVRNHVGPQEEFEVVWAGPWAYRNQLADRFRNGRVFLVGDAAHAFSPFGGRGGNSGVQDSENLAWKLALVLQGTAPDALLDSYNDERREAARHNIHVTSETNEFLNPASWYRRMMRNCILESARHLPLMRRFVNSGKMSVPFVYK